MMDIELDRVDYSNDWLTIHFSNYGKVNRNYSELFDFLGDHDIITASELGSDVILMSGEIYFFTRENEKELQEKSKVAIKKYCLLNEFINNDNPDGLSFVKWYNND